MDSCTAAMCEKAWGRPGFAKVLVEIWAVGELKRELEVEIPSLDGGADAKVKIRVEYIWEPVQCSHCLVFGHKTNTCAKAVSMNSVRAKAPVVDSDGFTKVTRKQWKPKNVQVSNSLRDEFVNDTSNTVHTAATVSPTAMHPMQPLHDPSPKAVGNAQAMHPANNGEDSLHGEAQGDGEAKLKEGALESGLDDNNNGPEGEMEDGLERGRCIGSVGEDGTTEASIAAAQIKLSTPVREQAPTLAAVAKNLRPPIKPLRGILKTSNKYNVLSGANNKGEENLEELLDALLAGKQGEREQGNQPFERQNV